MNYNLSTNEYKYKAINPFIKSHKRCFMFSMLIEAQQNLTRQLTEVDN